MSRLSKLYQTMENLKELGLSINEDLIQEANELEEEIIKKEILPVLSKTIEPALQPVKRELVLVVDYVPEQPLSVHLSRKRNFAAELTDAKEMVLDPEVTHRNNGSRLDEKIERGPTRDMTVVFPDGTIIAEKTAVETLINVVKKIGVAEVRKVVEEYNLKFCSFLCTPDSFILIHYLHSIFFSLNLKNQELCCTISYFYIFCHSSLILLR